MKLPGKLTWLTYKITVLQYGPLIGSIHRKNGFFIIKTISESCSLGMVLRRKGVAQ